MSINREKILEVKNLKQHFVTGIWWNRHVVKAVDGINFDIYKGETFGIVGESGCGKTTTGRSIIKLYDITGGEVFFKGNKISKGVSEYKYEIHEHKVAYKKWKRQTVRTYREEIRNLKSFIYKQSNDIDDKSKLDEQFKREKSNIDAIFDEKIARSKEELKLLIENNTNLYREGYAENKRLREASKEFYDKIQMIFQDPVASLNPRMTVKEIIAEGLRESKKFTVEEIEDKVMGILEVVGLLPDHASRYPHEFSGGQRQRIGIARALVMAPEIVIADEPISALDVSIQAQVINLMNKLQKMMGLTILFIAHDLSVVKYFSDRIAVMYFGRIVELADSKTLFKNPLHPYTRSLLSAVPLPNPEYERKRLRMDYDPTVHNYDVETPEMVEIQEGHFVYASPSEVEEYKTQLN